MTGNRKDLEVQLLSTMVFLTEKQMSNGETRVRARLHEHAVLTITTAAEGGWQEAHFHKGLCEIYVPLEGSKMVLAVRDDRGKTSFDLCEGFRPHIVLPKRHHNVYLPAGATIATMIVGEPVGNPDRKGNDWYPADERFAEWVGGLRPPELWVLATDPFR